jgi:hypothetical protein
VLHEAVQGPLTGNEAGVAGIVRNGEAQMTDDPKVARAEAKAAKAHAKELRPWFKKKRWWLAGAVGLLVIGVAASGGGRGGNQVASSGETTGSSSPTTVSQGLGSQDATADVSELNCGSPDALGFSYPSVRVTNNSEKTSTYFITVVSETADGSERFDQSTIVVSSLNPGQSQKADGLPFTEQLPSGAICRLSEVQRTAG